MEWLAAACQDNHRAIVIGSPTTSARLTWGNAIVKSSLPVGGGEWCFLLATGVLERGNGKPLSLFERMIGTMIEAPEKMANGVVPDHRLDEKGASANDIRWSLRKADSVRTAPILLKRRPLTCWSDR